MVKKTLEPNNTTYMNDRLTIEVKRQYVYFNVFVDGCGNDFIIQKEDLQRMLK